MADWHYLASDRSQHQAEEHQLDQLVSGGVIRPETLVWKNGMDQWKPASEVLGHLFGDDPAGTAPMPPPPSSGAPVRSNKVSHEIDYEIIGDDLQLVEIELDPQETVIAEAGAMSWMDEQIQFEARMGDGSKANEGIGGMLKGLAKRAFTGESLFMTHFTNVGHGKKKVAFAGPYPGHIVPLELNALGGDIMCQKDAFLCAAKGTEVSIGFNKKIGTGFFGGEGFIMQRLKGDGLAFIHAGGTIVRRELKGEKVLVDTGCLVGFTSGIDYSIERAGNLKSMFFGGEGLFLATLQGHGTIWLQTLPFSRMADRILSAGVGPRSKGEGSLLGGIGDMLGGD